MLTAFLLMTAQCESPCIRPATEAEKRQVIAEFDETAFDGPAARWRWIDTRDGTVCGYVNGKNRLGAYTGWTPFAFTQEHGLSIYSDPDREWLWKIACLGIYEPA